MFILIIQLERSPIKNKGRDHAKKGGNPRKLMKNRRNFCNLVSEL